MKRRNLFAEISEGFDALKLEREREVTSQERLPAVTPPLAPAPCAVPNFTGTNATASTR